MQVISCPQHNGDFIFPCPLGHFETWTSVPSSSVSMSFTKGASHLAQVALTAMPHLLHLYVAIDFSICLKFHTNRIKDTSYMFKLEVGNLEGLVNGRFFVFVPCVFQKIKKGSQLATFLVLQYLQIIWRSGRDLNPRHPA